MNEYVDCFAPTCRPVVLILLLATVVMTVLPTLLSGAHPRKARTINAAERRAVENRIRPIGRVNTVPAVAKPSSATVLIAEDAG